MAATGRRVGCSLAWDIPPFSRLRKYWHDPEMNHQLLKNCVLNANFFRFLFLWKKYNWNGRGLKGGRFIVATQDGWFACAQCLICISKVGYFRHFAAKRKHQNLVERQWNRKNCFILTEWKEENKKWTKAKRILNLIHPSFSTCPLLPYQYFWNLVAIGFCLFLTFGERPTARRWGEHFWQTSNSHPRKCKRKKALTEP